MVVLIGLLVGYFVGLLVGLSVARSVCWLASLVVVFVGVLSWFGLFGVVVLLGGQLIVWLVG